MSESKPMSPALLAASIAAMVFGLGLLLFELSSGMMFRVLPKFLLWAVYLVLLLVSVWGMKTWLEAQADSFSSVTRTLLSGMGLLRRPQTQSHNLFRLPAEGQIYLMILIIMLLGALFSKTNTLMLIFALMAGPFIVNGGITFSVTRRLEMSRRLPRRIMQGDPISVDITVRNEKRLIASSLIAIEDQIVGPREMLTGKLMFALIPARQARTGRYQVRFMQRGRYRLGPTRITSRFPLGIVERGRQVEVYDDLLVYPRIGVFAMWWLRQLSDGQEASRLAQGQTGAFQDEFHRIREYRPGDELRSIHWKTSARRNELMVREYRQNRDRKLLIILDLHIPTGEPASQETERVLRTEHAVSLATSLGWNYAQECGVVNLDCVCLGGETWEWLGSRRLNTPESFLDTMAVVEAGPQFAAADIEQVVQRHQTGGTRCVVITTRKEHDLLAEMSHGGFDRQSAGQGILIIEADPAVTRSFFELASE